MVLVPPFVEVDGLVVPLRVYVAKESIPSAVRLNDMSIPQNLDGLMYVVDALLGKSDSEVLALLVDRKRVPMPQELCVAAVPPGVWPDSDYAKGARNWERLTGTRPDMSDVYTVGASFLDDAFNLIIPRSSLIKLMTKLYELNDAVREGRMEARIDDSIPMPPPRPEPPEPPAPRWTDDEVQELEDQAVDVDERDPLTEDMTDAETARRVADQRSFLFAMLEVAYLRTERGEDDLTARYRDLKLPTLQTYSAALLALGAYLHDPERAAILSAASLPLSIPDSPFDADISVDLFRLPCSALTTPPAGLSAHAWLAHCEAAFVHSRTTGAGASGTAAGDLFTRIRGQLVRLRYRPETTPTLRLWRVVAL
jgi:hypothetical protein